MRACTGAPRGQRAGAGPWVASCGWHSHRGFTLIEVLIALAIVAIALGAAMRAMASLSTDTEAARERTLALWSADNRLAEIRIAHLWREPGTYTSDCPQGRYRFVCRENVTVSSNPALREISVGVYRSLSSATLLAEAVTVIQNEPMH